MIAYDACNKNVEVEPVSCSRFCRGKRSGMFIARGLHKGEQDLDEDEYLNVVEVPLGELVEQVFDSRIKDGKTQVALLKAAVRGGMMKRLV